jgi:hypothetical protein
VGAYDIFSTLRATWPSASAANASLTCSIGFGTGIPVYEAPPGSIRGLHLVVTDIEAARAELIARGVDVGEIEDVGRGVTYAGFEDPDGNGWTLQLMPWRTGNAF